MNSSTPETPHTETARTTPGARFAGGTVIVTGAASGIGRAVADQVVADGGHVVAADLTEEGLHSLVEDSPAGSVTAVAGDITSAADRERVVAAADGRIDGLANIAGIMDGMVPLHETSDELWSSVLSINLDALFRLTREVIPVMREAGSGSVVNVASEAALRGNAAGAAYTAAKHAVVGLTEHTAFFYAPDGLRANAVAPGPTATGIEGSMRSDLARGRIGPFMQMIPPVATAASVASSITWLLSPESENVNGVVLPSDGGWAVQ